MKDSEKQRWTCRLLTSVIGAAFLGFFALVWQVHAFDVQKKLLAVDSNPRVEQPPRQPASVGPAGAASAVSPLQRPDRWSDGDVVSALSNFYQTIITLMGLLLGVIGILAVLTLRFLSKSAAEDIAHQSAKEAMRHYLETRQFGDNVEFALQETGLGDQLEKLASDIEQIKRILKSRNNVTVDQEYVEGEVSLSPDGEMR